MSDTLSTYEIWKGIATRLKALQQRRNHAHQIFKPARVSEIFHWAVVHDKPVSWACVPGNWPPHMRRFPLPDQSTMSRRLRDPEVVDLLHRLEREMHDAPSGPPAFAAVDAMPLPIGPASHDRQSGYGYACAGTKARGYRLHVICGAGVAIAWRLTPMQACESEIARRMVRGLEDGGWMVGDSSYHATRLFEACDEHGGIRLLAPRKRSQQGGGVGHRKWPESRLEAIRRVESDPGEFVPDLLHQRSTIERFFGRLRCTGGGLGPLPAWVRGYRRVRLWVEAKLAVIGLRTRLKSRLTAQAA